MDIFVLPGRYSICQMPADARMPTQLLDAAFCSITRTREELSLVISESIDIGNFPAERNVKIIQIAGPLEMNMIGVLAGLSAVLAEARIPIFAISTFNTDYILVREEHLTQALRALSEGGYNLRE